MSVENRNSLDRLAATLFALLKNATSRHRLPAGQQQATREALNALLAEVSHSDFAEMLQRLYRIAEADARKRAGGSLALIRDRVAPQRIIGDPPPPKASGNQF